MSKKEEREAHYADMIEFYQRAKDQLPLGGRMPIGHGAAAPVRFGKTDAAPTLSEEEMISAAEEAAKRMYEGGEKVTLDKVYQERLQKATSQNGPVTQVR